MQITKHTDHALRLLMYVAVRAERTTVAEVAEALSISRHHLVKIANRLGELGYLELFRGNAGGISLGQEPSKITVGEVFRKLENCVLVECFDRDSSECVLSDHCVLETTLQAAFAAFCKELDDVTLADLVRKRKQLRTRVGLDSEGHPA